MRIYSHRKPRFLRRDSVVLLLFTFHARKPICHADSLNALNHLISRLIMIRLTSFNRCCLAAGRKIRKSTIQLNINSIYTNLSNLPDCEAVRAVGTVVGHLQEELARSRFELRFLKVFLSHGDDLFRRYFPCPVSHRYSVAPGWCHFHTGASR